MPDNTPKRDEVKAQKPAADKVDELPTPTITDRDAQSVKGGGTTKMKFNEF